MFFLSRINIDNQVPATTANITLNFCMYTDYFGFREEPFNVTADPRFFYETPMYQEAYANLLSGIHERKGFLLLTGEAGIGKTTLLHRLRRDLEEPICCVFFDNASLTFEELLSFICAELGLPEEETGRLQKIRALNAFVLARMQEGGTGVLLIDEGQDLEDQVLENLRLLLNTQVTAETPLFQTVLVGQPELEHKLAQPKLRQLKQRIALQYKLAGIHQREVGPFIHHQLRAVGCDRQDLFPPDVIERIAEYSQGVPRLINIICDNALLTAYNTTQKVISAQIIQKVARDLDLTAGSGAARALGREPAWAPQETSQPEPAPEQTEAKAEKVQEKRASALFPEQKEEGVHPSRVLSWGSLLSGAAVLLLFAVGGVLWQQFKPRPPSQVSFEPSSAVPARAPSPAVPALVITRAEPDPEAGPELVIAEAQAVQFGVEAQSAEGQPLKYVWLLDGQEQAQGPRWTYTPTFDEGGDQAKAIAAVITDQAQHRVEQRWQVRVANVNRPPVFSRIMPAAEEVDIQAGETQRFTVEATDPDVADGLIYRWSLDGREMSQAMSWEFEPLAAGPEQATHRVSVAVFDQGGHKAEQQWTVVVAAAQPVPPQILRVKPAALELRVAEGQAVQFSVEAQSAQGEPLEYVWLLDGQEQAQGPRWTYAPTFDEGGDQAKAIAAVITDQAQQRVEQHWQVRVADVNRPPAIRFLSPTAKELEVEVGETQRFTVEAADPDTADELAYRWSLDGQEVGQGVSWVFGPSAPAVQNRRWVGVEVADRGGLKAQSAWRVTVTQPVPPPRPIAARPKRQVPQPPALPSISEQEVRTWVEAQRQAWEAKNIDQLVTMGVLPQPNADRAQAILSEYRSFRVALQEIQIRLKGSQAEVSFSRIDTIDGRVVPHPDRKVFLLDKEAGDRLMARLP